MKERKHRTGSPACPRLRALRMSGPGHASSVALAALSILVTQSSAFPESTLCETRSRAGMLSLSCPPGAGLELGPDSSLGLSSAISVFLQGGQTAHKLLSCWSPPAFWAPWQPVHLPEPWLFHCLILSATATLAVARSTPRGSNCLEQAPLFRG